MRIGLVAAEMAPLAKVGGLADVVGALAQELAARGHAVTLLLPAYGTLDPALLPPLSSESVGVAFDGGSRDVRLRRGRHGRVELVLLDDPLVPRGLPYQYGDLREEARCHGLLARVAADWLGPRVDLLHLHDHHPSLAAVLLHGHPRPAVLLTVHNLAFQGLHEWAWLEGAGVGEPGRALLDWWGRPNSLKGALLAADAINTVSPTYAREILQPEHGCGLDKVLAWRGEALSGILNGIDTAVWNPATDPHLAARYSREEPSGKEPCRVALARELGLASGGDRPIVGVVSRLTDQKGIDLLFPVLPEVLAVADLAVLGSGEARLETALRRVAGPRAGVRIGFDEALAHRIEAGSDLFLMPSRFEPCGLNQMISLRYGTLPVVRRVGGLADTVVDADLVPERGFGFVFERTTAAALYSALFRGLKAVRDGRLPELVRRAMSVDVSWTRSAAAYEALMAATVARHPPGTAG